MKEKEADKNNPDRRMRFVLTHYQEKRFDPDKAWDNFARQQEIRKTIPFRRYFYPVASILLLLVTIGSLYFWNQGRPQWVMVTSVTGEIKNVVLPDQSLLTLAGGSTVRYDARRFAAKAREIELTGKAWFEVQRNEELPFSITTPLSKVIVLGTSFELSDSGTEVTLHVFTGKVSFSAEQGEELILTTGMSVQYSPEKEAVEISEEMNPNQLSWKTGELVFDNTPLSRVIQDLQSYYNREIRNVPSGEDIRLTASFNRMPLEDVLLIINQTLDLGLKAEH